MHGGEATFTLHCNKAKTLTSMRVTNLIVLISQFMDDTSIQ